MDPHCEGCRERDAVIARLEGRVAELERFQQGMAYLRDEDRAQRDLRPLTGESQAMKAVRLAIGQVARTDSTVLILGETGTGKELIARAIHQLSPRRDHLMVAVNCAALAPGIIASELFGHEQGAFTGAVRRRLGRFELAQKGTIFLDEIGELPAETQVLLLRVLQERVIERVGGSEPVPVDVRVIAATHQDLAAAMNAGRFRSDLFFRLSVFPMKSIRAGCKRTTRSSPRKHRSRSPSWNARSSWPPCGAATARFMAPPARLPHSASSRRRFTARCANSGFPGIRISSGSNFAW